MAPSRALSDDTPTDICCISTCSAAASTPPPTAAPLSTIAVAVAASPAAEHSLHGVAVKSGGGGSDESFSPGSACWLGGAVARRSPTGPRPIAGPRPPGLLLIRARDCSTAASSTAFHLSGDASLSVRGPSLRTLAAAAIAAISANRERSTVMQPRAAHSQSARWHATD